MPLSTAVSKETSSSHIIEDISLIVISQELVNPFSDVTVIVTVPDFRSET